LVCSNVEVEVGVTKVFEERPRFCWGQQPKTANNTSRRQPQNERVNVQTSVASFSVFFFFKSCFCLTKTSRSRTMKWNGCPKLRTVWRVFCWGFSRIRNANQECAEIVVTNNVKRSGLWWIEDGLRMRKCSARKKTKSFFISNSTCIDGWCLRWMEILACADEREMCVGFAFACFSCREKRPGENLVEVKNRKTCKSLKKSGKLWLNLLNWKHWCATWQLRIEPINQWQCWASCNTGCCNWTWKREKYFRRFALLTTSCCCDTLKDEVTFVEFRSWVRKVQVFSARKSEKP